VDQSFERLHLDFDGLPPLTSPRRALGLRGVALGVISLAPGQGSTFTHHHELQEEVYVVIEGRGVLCLDGVLHPISRGDLVRVSPPVRRALRADPAERLLVICAGGVPAGFPRDPGARYLIDDGIPHYDDPPPWCRDDPEALRRNALLSSRMEAARRRREARDGGAGADSPGSESGP
jgi:hypothetical protein